MQDALEDAGAPEPWTLAESYATAGLDGAFVQQVADAAGPVTPSALRWIARIAVGAAHGTRAGRLDRPDEPPGQGLKQYAYMDQGEVVAVDLREGIENTLMILGHKLKKTTIEVTRDYDESLARSPPTAPSSTRSGRTCSTTRSTRSAPAATSRS